MRELRFARSSSRGAGLWLGCALLLGAALVAVVVLRPRARADAVATPARTVVAAEDKAARYKSRIQFSEVASLLERLPADVPAPFGGSSTAERERAWSAWVIRHESDIRSRIERGDLDSIVNLWLYGTGFTRLPRLTAAEIRAAGASRAEEIMLQRLDDLVEAAGRSGDDDRLRFTREVMVRRGIDPFSQEGTQRARLLLAETRNEIVAENRRYGTRLESTRTMKDYERLSAYASVYDDRGLSTDTSIGVNFAIDAALGALSASGQIPGDSVHRVAIVGPGLDFVDKAEGGDFYPPQTLQPFAVIDSLRRLHLSAGNLHATTLDVSRRVNAHIDTAVRLAAAGTPYVLQLPLDIRESRREWTPDLVGWWMRLGDTVGEPVEPMRPREDIRARLRAIRIRPEIVASVTPLELNVILDRLTQADEPQFDLVIATNVLVYYGAFEQVLALANITSMLRPGGLLLTNYVVSSPGVCGFDAPSRTPAVFDRQGNGDTILVYKRLRR